MKSDIAFLQKT